MRTRNGLAPFGDLNPAARRLFYQKKYPYPFTTDPVKSPANIRETANGNRFFTQNEVIRIAAHDSRFAQDVEVP